MNRKKVMAAVAGLLVVVFGLSAFSVSSAAASAYRPQSATHVDPRDQVALPRGSVAWAYEDFDRWLLSSELSSDDSLKLESLQKADDPMPLVFTSISDYKDWVISLEPEVAAMVNKISVRIKGSNLPDTIVVEGSKDGVSSMRTSGEKEYIIVPMALTFCTVCGFLVGTIVGWALGKWVYDPIYEWLVLKWKEWKSCLNNHLIEETECVEYGQCPYRPWCLGSWQRVIRDYGTSADCECECGAVWTEYNPRY